jgi:hypothetical protein
VCADTREKFSAWAVNACHPRTPVCKLALARTVVSHTSRADPRADYNEPTRPDLAAVKKKLALTLRHNSFEPTFGEARSKLRAKTCGDFKVLGYNALCMRLRRQAEDCWHCF